MADLQGSGSTAGEPQKSESGAYAASDIERLRHTVKSQRGMLKQQGKEIVRLNRVLRGREAQVLQTERTNGRVARDLIDAWEFIWRVAGGLYVGGNARQAARVLLLNRKTPDAERIARKANAA